MAREYSPHDLTVFAVVHVLDRRVGVRRKQIAGMISKLRKALLVPREVDPSPYLSISFDPLNIEYVTGEIPMREGVLVSLGPINEAVDRYLGVGRPRRAAQETLRLPPTVVRARRRRGGG